MKRGVQWKKEDCGLGSQNWRHSLGQTNKNNKPPFDPNPYTVVEVNGTQAIFERDGKRKKRSFNKNKVIKDKVKKKNVEGEEKDVRKGGPWRNGKWRFQRF